VTRTTTPLGIASLAGRLIDAQDRETYAALVSYINELPPGDEFRQLMEMLGLISLLGQRIPDALAEFLAELRGQTKASAEYHAQVDARLADLPAQIAEGVDPAAIAKEMSESFRQQIAATGLQDTTAMLKATTGSIKSLAFDASASLKPAAQEIRGIASTILHETAKLVAAARNLESHNARLIVQQRANGWMLQALIALVLFLIGGFCGIMVEKRDTTDAIASVSAQFERIQAPTVAPPAVEVSKKNRK
jgi:hypothetical protein